MKKVLPLLALPEYYEHAKLGYARGGMPVAFVDRVRGYYDVLLAQQPPYQPRLARRDVPFRRAASTDGAPLPRLIAGRRSSRRREFESSR